MIRINYTLHQFLRENMRTGISNMKDIRKLMLGNFTYMFRVPMTVVLIQISSFCKSTQRLKVYTYRHELLHKCTKAHSEFR